MHNKLAFLAVGILAAVPLCAQPARSVVAPGKIHRGVARRSLNPARHLRKAIQTADPQASAVFQAPGVIQFNLLDNSHMAWFVTTDTLPAGAEIWADILMPDGTDIALDSLVLDSAIGPGESLDLPSIRNFGYFWPSGLLTYWVGLYINGKEYQAAADFPVWSARSYDDLTYMSPLITSTEEGIGNRDVLLNIYGSFTSGTPYVLLDDIVVPRNAVVSGSNSQLVVNLSKVPGLDLSVMQERLLTVGQSGWSDTAVLRHIPPRPGSYNPAPR